MGFVLALSGEFATYRNDKIRDAAWQAQLDAAGTPEKETFPARDEDDQKFTLKFEPLFGSVELLINGLDEPTDIYSVHGREVTLSTKVNRSDTVTIKYRHKALGE